MSPVLARVIFWAAAISCVIAHGVLIRSVLTGAASGGYPDDRRKQPRRGGMRWGPDRRSEPAGEAPSSSRELEIGWALLPALSLAALLVATWLALPD